MDSLGGLAVVFGYSNSNTVYPSLAITGQSTSDSSGTWETPIITLKNGSHDENTTRYGDYFGASIDESNETKLWVTGEYNIRPNNHASTFISPMQIDDYVPVANAGQPQTVNSGTVVTLDGSQSFDPDGDSITYSWTQSGGQPTVTLLNPNTVHPTFTAPNVSVSTNLQFHLVVNDGRQNSANLNLSYVNIFVNPTGSNCVPPPSGNWNVSSSCALSQSSTAFANVNIQGNSILTIPNGFSLNIDLTHYHLFVDHGSGVLINPGGKISTPYINQFLFSFGSFGSGNGQFNSPYYAASDSSGNIYITDQSNNRVEKFNSSGAYVSQFGSSGSGNGQFSTPMGIALDGSGNIWVVDNGNNRIENFTSAGIYTSQFGSSGSGNGQFSSPEGIAIDSSGNIYVVDNGNSRVEKFNSGGSYISQIGSYGPGNGQLAYPRGISLDSSGNIYVVDSNNERIEKFNSAGTYLSKFGSLGSGNGQFIIPTGIALDSSGNIYVTDSSNNRVEKFDSSGTFFFKFGSYGSGNGQFNHPSGITIDSSGNIYVVDTHNNRIEKWR